jgi:hypothetical protein
MLGLPLFRCLSCFSFLRFPYRSGLILILIITLLEGVMAPNKVLEAILDDILNS